MKWYLFYLDKELNDFESITLFQKLIKLLQILVKNKVNASWQYFYIKTSVILKDRSTNI